MGGNIFFYEWRMNSMQCVFHHAQFCFPKHNLKRWLPLTPWGLFGCLWVNSRESSEINNDIYNSMWTNFKSKLQNYTTGLDKQIFTGERLRYSLSNSLTMTECAFPSAEWEKKILVRDHWYSVIIVVFLNDDGQTINYYSYGLYRCKNNAV